MIETDERAPAWARRWWRWMDWRIGIVPAPVVVILLALFAGFLATGKVASDILMAIGLLGVGGFFGRPCARTVCSKPICRVTFARQASPP